MKKLPPPPIKEQMVSSMGIISPQWVAFIQKLIERITELEQRIETLEEP